MFAQKDIVDVAVSNYLKTIQEFLQNDVKTIKLLSNTLRRGGYTSTALYAELISSTLDEMQTHLVKTYAQECIAKAL